MSKPTLCIADLVVERGDKRVVDGLSLSLMPGEIYALLGGNGAGKSTTLFAILGFLKRQAGSLMVAGIDASADPDAVRTQVAYLPENVALYDHLTARENVDYFLKIAGRPRSRADVEAGFEGVGLAASAWDERTTRFSKGMRQKTAIALALLRETPLLLLDEPTSGLDPAAASDFHRLLEALAKRDVAILMVTHDLLGAADTADRIGLIQAGRIAREWTAAPTEPRFDLNALHSGFASAR
ncbi:ABC transporter ATP-binding protein [Polymorphobacter fuscus]|uniref:ATP-binding cassette domain-containing protein n=1 Tax=Sandarakinorhabdus fusca TaxID=1439888 RepID=A0A7C9GRT5_9SPHN|nr:ABC transporter ATP-binding protein [Polymorphobacter fuscus]KAB7643644.1 ABC transporter ATP-binding protein [Polymorphobacter fuscus]MQT18730.1 ATP-binding cassette domain-containing protein [Polymorphobacter fuscus]NJC09619.1 ABC-2 type transport system ATP-binding protein [Polymorphobacter fuscus]